jgi:hypothetical protein
LSKYLYPSCLLSLGRNTPYCGASIDGQHLPLNNALVQVVARPITELDAYVQRFPVPSRVALGFNLLATLLGNLYLLWLMWHGELSLTRTILLIFAECILLSVLEAMQRSFVPESHRMKYAVETSTVPQKLVSWIGCIVGVGGAYLFWIYKTNEVDTLIAFCTSYKVWRESGLDVALGITLGFAVTGLWADYKHYRVVGPPLMSSVSLEAMARRIVFIYGALVFAIPFVFTLGIAIFGILRIVGERKDKRWHMIGGIAIVGAFFAISAALASAIDSGSHGLTSVYLLGKVLVEVLFVLMPVLASRHKAADFPSDTTSSPISKHRRTVPR